MSDHSLRIIFAGTPEFAATHLKALSDSKHQLQAVFTQPDRPAGRGKKLHASAVKQCAEQLGLPLHQPVSLKDTAEQQALAAMDADVMIVVAYGLILPQVVLDIPRLGCLNVHASLLPRWRGAAPIQRAIEAGDAITGATIMQMDAGLDTGAMLATIRCPIGPQDTAASLLTELGQLGPEALLAVLEDLPGHQNRALPQPEQGASYAKKMTKSEAQIDWQRSADELDRQIRAFNPLPVCFSLLQQERVRIWQARPLADQSAQPPGTLIHADETGILVSCGTGQLRIEVLQLPGGKELAVAQLLRARAALFAAGQRFEPVPVSNR